MTSSNPIGVGECADNTTDDHTPSIGRSRPSVSNPPSILEGGASRGVGLRRVAPLVAPPSAGGAEAEPQSEGAKPAWSDLARDWVHRRRVARFNAAQAPRPAETAPTVAEPDEAGG